MNKDNNLINNESIDAQLSVSAWLVQLLLDKPNNNQLKFLLDSSFPLDGSPKALVRYAYACTDLLALTVNNKNIQFSLEMLFEQAKTFPIETRLDHLAQFVQLASLANKKQLLQSLQLVTSLAWCSQIKAKHAQTYCKKTLKNFSYQSRFHSDVYYEPLLILQDAFNNVDYCFEQISLPRSAASWSVERYDLNNGFFDVLRKRIHNIGC